MKIAIFDTHQFERHSLTASNQSAGHDLHFLEARLTKETASLALGFSAVCDFANDRLDAACLEQVQKCGVRLIALRCAGSNNVDLKSAAPLGLPAVRVPEYSPHSVAEHAVGLMLALNRKLHRAYNRFREMNFSLEGLVGFDMYGKTIGIVGTGRIGSALVRIVSGFGCQILAYDLFPNKDLESLYNVTYVALDTLFQKSDIISLHIPLNDKTHHLINGVALQKMRKGVMLINTSRGGLLDTKALIKALKHGQIGSA